MIFEGLKSKMGYFRGLFDHKLTPGVYTLIMIDGHNFSRRVKNKFKKPFDQQFIGYMNEVAIRICQEFQGIRLAYTQSDEISFLMTDFDGDKICLASVVIRRKKESFELLGRAKALMP